MKVAWGTYQDFRIKEFLMTSKSIESVEQLEVLHAKYPIVKGFALSGDSVIFWLEDQRGNHVKISIQAGQFIQYEEIPFEETTELSWDDKAAAYKHRKRSES
jgi:hypothetical protein